jgi:hypothetical protein
MLTRSPAFEDFWNSCKNMQALAGTRVDETPAMANKPTATTVPFHLIPLITRDDGQTAY